MMTENQRLFSEARRKVRQGRRGFQNGADPAVSRHMTGTGSAVTDLIFSIAKREVTFFSGTAPISFL